MAFARRSRGEIVCVVEEPKDILAIEEELASYKVGSPEYLSKLREGTLKKQNLDLEEFLRE